MKVEANLGTKRKGVVVVKEFRELVLTSFMSC